MPTGATETLRVEIRLRDFMSRQLKRAAGSIQRFAAFTANKFRALGRAVLSLRGAIVALGVGILAKSFIAAGSAMEKFRVQITAVLDGNKALAEQTIKWLRDFAAATPFTTKAVIESFVTLKAAGVDVTKSMLNTIGNVGFVFDQSIADLSIALVGMEKEVFKRLGIGWTIVGQQATITLGNMAVKTDKSIGSMRKAILGLWEKKFPGAMKEAENTWTGLVALLQSKWFEFQVDVLESGVFEFLKEGLRVAAASFADFSKDPKAVAESIIVAMEAVGKVFAAVADGVTVLKIAFIGLGIGARGVMVGISAAVTGILTAMSSLFSGIQQILVFIDEQGGVVKDTLESTLGVSIDDIRVRFQNLEETVTSFAEAGKTVTEGHVAAIKAMADEIQRLRETSKSEEIEKFFAKVKEGLKVREELAKLGEEYRKLFTLKEEAFATGNMEEFTRLVKQLALNQKAFAIHGERGAEALANARDAIVALRNGTEVTEKNVEKIAKSAKRVEGSLSIWTAQFIRQAAFLVDAAKSVEAFEKIYDETKITEADNAMQKWADTFNEVKSAAMAVGNVLVNNIMRSVDAALEGTFRWKRALQEVAQDLSKMLLRQALMAGVQFAAGQIAGLAAPGPAIPPAPAIGRGGVVYGGLGFQSAQAGTVVRGPTPLLAGDDRRGVGEGILPLAKTRGGELGVQAVGGGSAPMQVQFNIYTIDSQGVDDFFYKNRHRMSEMTGINMTEGRAPRGSF